MAKGSIGNLSLFLSADTAQFKRDLDRAGSLVDSSGKAMRAKFDRMGNELAQTRLASTPFNIRRQVMLEGAMNAATARRDSLLASARINAGQGRFGQMGAAVGMQGAGIGIDKLLMGLGKLGPYAAVAGAAIGVAAAATIGMWKAMVSLASAASPVAAERYAKAWSDLSAVVGRVFVPVLEIGTDAVRLFADFMATILPSSSQVREALAPLKDVMGDIRIALADVAPLIKMWLVDQLRMAALAIKFFSDQIRQMIAIARAMPGGQVLFGTAALAGGGGLASSFNAAPTGRSFIGLEDLREKNILANMDAGGSAPPTAAQAEQTNAKLDTLINVTSRIADPYGIGRAMVGFATG